MTPHLVVSVEAMDFLGKPDAKLFRKEFPVGIGEPLTRELCERLSRFCEQLSDSTKARQCVLDLCELDLKGMDLERYSLGDAQLSGAQLIKARLKGAQLYRANLNYVNLQDADLREASLSGASVTGAIFLGADLCSANLENVVGWEGAQFKGALYNKSTKLPKGFDPEALEMVNLTPDGRPTCPRITVTSARLTRMGYPDHMIRMLLDVLGGEVRGVVQTPAVSRALATGPLRRHLGNLDCCHIVHLINVTGESLYKADLRGASLQWGTFSGVDARGADFRGADLTGAHVGYMDARDADFRGANLSGVHMSGMILFGALYDENTIFDSKTCGTSKYDMKFVSQKEGDSDKSKK